MTNHIFPSLEFFRKNFGLTQEEFCDYGEYAGSIPLSSSYYDRLRKGLDISANKLIAVTEALNQAIRNHRVLKLRFPNGVTSEELTTKSMYDLALGI